MIQTAQAELTITQQKGLASWYGEAHRGKLMANGKKFDPDKLTAASWFYPLGTRVRVTIVAPDFAPRSVLVTITDRGPAKRLVEQGRVIDLGRAAFQKIAAPDLGLVEVSVEPVR
jgi:rare lipoprotein A